ncbi:MAG: NAD(P)/FAD-dependent oxidoreductase [Halapricum sp.]
MPSIGIVGAGAAATAAAFALYRRISDVEITVLEKSGGLCGRAATRRRGPVTYDYGANYVTDGDPRVTELLTETLDTDGLVDTVGPVYTYEADGEIRPGRDADGHKWTYRTGLTQIAKRLLGETDAAVHRETRVETIHREDGHWELTDADGQSWGPFDALLLNPPAPQTADLLRGAEWDDPIREELTSAVSAVDDRSVWSAVLHYPFEVDVPYYAAVNTDKEHSIGWVSREECKPGHVPDGESVLIVQAGQDWSGRHIDDPPADVIDELIHRTAELLGDDRLREPNWTDHQRWRYALPEEAVRAEPLAAARRRDLYCVGDWIPGKARIYAALANGLDTGEKLATRL